MQLTEKRCRPCEGDEPPLSAAEADKLLRDVDAWDRRGDEIHREFVFKDFAQAIDFVNAVGEIAEDEGHHPDIFLHGYKHVRLTLKTHAIDGLSENDFILAAKVDRMHGERSS